MDFKCDVALLCELVEGRPCLWDKRNPNFKNRFLREKAWQEVHQFLDDEYETRTSEEKKDIGDKICSKWVNIRDAFVRSLRTKNGQTASKKYIYYEHLQFLLATHEPSETESSMSLDEENMQIISVEEDNSPSDAFSFAVSSSGASGNKSSRKRCNDFSEIEQEIVKELKNPKIEEKKCSFFSSFEEYIVDMSETEKIQLHMDILKSISTIKQNRNHQCRCFHCNKKYAVVTFIEENSVEVIPTNWLTSETEAKWPNTSATSMISKFIKDSTPPSSSWSSLNIKINSFSNTFSKATRKAAKAVNTSHLSSDSPDDVSNQRRKRRKPARYQSSSSSGSESESIITNKKYNIPSMPRNEVEGNTSKHTSNSQGNGLPDAAMQFKMVQKDTTPTSIYSQLFQSVEKMKKMIGEMNAKIDNLGSQVERLTNTTNPVNSVLCNLPDDVNFPISTLEELQQLNDKLRCNKEYSANLVRFLYHAGSGKSQRSFILSLTKKVLSQEVAVQFSRFGRKGKKSFQNYAELLTVILGAASLKFKDADREDLAESFGKSLAGASDWCKRIVRPLDLSSDSSLTFKTE